MKRSSGILMHISSLPGKHGIGTFGKEAFAFVDFMKKSGQKYWQILPLGQTSYGDSPYQCFSAFAGNPYFIDFDLLREKGLLKEEDYSLYMAVKNHFNLVSWQKWDEDIRLRKKEAINKYKKELKEEMDFWNYIQYEFFNQWIKLKNYANENGIEIIGDIPIYVAEDSADVWSNPTYF